MWAGGKRPSNGATFEWVDGTDWDYSNWRGGEPNSANELYLEINYPGNGWNDWNGLQPQKCLFSEPVGVIVSEKPSLIV